MTDAPADLTESHVTQHLLRVMPLWRVRAVERLEVDSASSYLRHRSLQCAPLRPILADICADEMDDRSEANIVLPLAVLPKGPLVDLDIHGPLGTGQLIVRSQIAERQAGALVTNAKEAGLRVPDTVVAVLPALLGFSEGPWLAVQGLFRSERKRLEEVPRGRGVRR